MKKYLPLIIAGGVVAALLIVLLVTGGKKGKSSKSSAESGTVESVTEIARNDYAGAYSRLVKIQQDVADKLEILDEHNYKVQQGNPEDYWSENDFFFLNLLPVYTKELEYTQYLNESDDFSTLADYIKTSLEDLGYENPSVRRNAENDYYISYKGTFTNKNTGTKGTGKKTLHAVYDAGTNSFRVTSSIKLTYDNSVCDDFFYEFREIGPREYAVQNDNERLSVKYNDSGEITSFYYSALNNTESGNYKAYFDETEYKALYNDCGFTGILYEIPGYEDIYYGEMPKGGIRYFSGHYDGNQRYWITENKNNIDNIGIDLSAENDYKQIPPMAILGRYTIDDNSLFNEKITDGKAWVMAGIEFKETVAYENKTLTMMTTNDLTKEKSSFSVMEVISPEQLKEDAALLRDAGIAENTLNSIQ